MRKENEYIELLDGTSLPCYPKVEEDLEMDSSHFTLAMIRYFVAGRWSRDKGMEKSIPLRELFWDNASTLYDIANRILSDSRLFFVPIPKPDDYGEGINREYTIRTLGMYAELWKSCPEATVIGKNGERLVCCDWTYKLQFAGKNGARFELRDYTSYQAITGKWREIQNRYKGKLLKYQCYSLLQVSPPITVLWQKRSACSSRQSASHCERWKTTCMRRTIKRKTRTTDRHLNFKQHKIMIEKVTPSHPKKENDYV